MASGSGLLLAASALRPPTTWTMLKCIAAAPTASCPRSTLPHSRCRPYLRTTSRVVPLPRTAKVSNTTSATGTSAAGSRRAQTFRPQTGELRPAGRTRPTNSVRGRCQVANFRMPATRSSAGQRVACRRSLHHMSPLSVLLSLLPLPSSAPAERRRRAGRRAETRCHRDQHLWTAGGAGRARGAAALGGFPPCAQTGDAAPAGGQQGEFRAHAAGAEEEVCFQARKRGRSSGGHGKGSGRGVLGAHYAAGKGCRWKSRAHSAIRGSAIAPVMAHHCRLPRSAQCRLGRRALRGAARARAFEVAITLVRQRRPSSRVEQSAVGGAGGSYSGFLFCASGELIGHLDAGGV
mmetsp:Transcript_28938/g.58247  ORF Transcript_28938/g.58247 Transcript_28938/m.58247 type:complete len:348 (+) Transcript_28938:421-1464(+)